MGNVISSVVQIAVGLGTGGFGSMVLSFALSMVASAVISKIFAPDQPKGGNVAEQANPGNRQQLPPAGDNKIPVVYGSAYVGGIITDLTISNNNQDVYWVLALSEVTNTDANSTGGPDAITFGNIYWGGKRVVFDANGYSVTGLLDESTNETQDITGKMDIYLYSNGSNNPYNSSQSAISVLSTAGLVYTWDSNKLMSNCAFAIIHLKYSQSKNLTGLQQTRFQVINSRKNTGDCFKDYLVSSRYGAAIAPALIDTVSLDALTAYSNTPIGYQTYTGGSSTLKRFEFNGTVDTSQKIMNNLQIMADCCDCLLKYNEITGKWGVIVQTPTVVPVMNINDSNMVSGITITPIDLANSFNIIEVKFPDGTAKDSFNSATFDLATLNPSLLFPNEPVNKQSVNLNLVNNNVTAQYIANRLLEAAREDLQVNVEIGFTGLQLEAGDIVTVTSANYGWTDKMFRLNKVVEKFAETGEITTALTMLEFNPAVYDDYYVTQFTPSPNTGIGSPTAFGTIPAPFISNSYPNIANPAFNVNVTASSAGITQYAEIWYSAYQYPTSAQRIFATTTQVQANGDPYDINEAMPPVQLLNIPAGDWYFFSRMVNSLASSDFSPASTKFVWRPTTFQFTERYVSVAYADDINGGGFTFNPRNKVYYGLYNTSANAVSNTASDYTWYLSDPNFGSNIYLAYINREARKFSFATDFATYAAGTAAFVPSSATKFDPSIWSALPDGTNIIDLDVRTGQLTQTGSTTVGAGQIAITNNPDGRVIASLDKLLDFGGAYTKTGAASSLTIDIYGRVLGFGVADDFYFTDQTFTATAGQTVFTPTTRDAGYITGQDLIFKNGILLDTTDYTETNSNFTLNVACDVGDKITCISMRAVSSTANYESLHITVESVSTNSIVWNAVTMPYQTINVGDILTFANTGTPTQYTVTNVNYSTRTITFSSSITANATDTVYRYRAAASSYPVFSRFSADLVDANTYTPTEWNIHSGYELLFINGSALTDGDYDIAGNTITNFPSLTTGKITVIQFSENNLTTPTGNPVNISTYSVANQTTYGFTYAPDAFDLYGNGVLLIEPDDYTTTTGSYSLVTAYSNNQNILVQQTFARAGAA